MFSPYKLAMPLAIEEAKKADSCGEVPVGAVITHFSTGKIIVKEHNRVLSLSDPTAHAEILAIRSAAFFFGKTRLPECDIIVSLEPCPMCAQAISFARFRRLIFGAYDPKGGGVDHGPKIFSQTSCNYKPEVIGGVDEKISCSLLKDFFKRKR